MDTGRSKYWIDFTMLITFLVTAITGIVMFFLLPGGTKLGPLRAVFGVTRQAWRDVHNWAGIIMLVLVLIHLALHWRWIIDTTRNIFQKKKIKKKDK
ncbi:DUF4405 domain-containing protein [Nanoarchaeota archaeon]